MVTPLFSKLALSRSSSSSPPIHFSITLNCNPRDGPVAYGPASTIHGQVALCMSEEDSIPANRIRVVFGGEVTSRSSGKNAKKHKQNSTEKLFEVESVLWGSPLPRPEEQENATPPSSPLMIPPGRNQYLFAIKLPTKNYPPTISDPNNPINVTFSLRTFLDRPNPSRHDKTEPVDIWYLPLIPCPSSTRPSFSSVDESEKVVIPESSNTKGKRKQNDLSVVVPKPSKSTSTSLNGTIHEVLRASSGEPIIEVTAGLAKPAYMPADTCTVRLMLKNRTERRNATINLSLVSYITLPASSLDSSASDTTTDSKTTAHTQTYLTESFNIVIPSHAQKQSEDLQFKIPFDAVPTISLRPTQPGGVCFDMSYEIRIVLLVGGTSMWPIPRIVNAEQLSLTLPLKIATVPHRFSLPLQLRIPDFSSSAAASSKIPVLATNDKVFDDEPEEYSDAADPIFIPAQPVLNTSSYSIDPAFISPMPSPLSPTSPFSPWAGTPLPSPLPGDTPQNFDILIPSGASVPIDSTGHLMVPNLTPAARQHRRTQSGTSSSENSISDGEVMVA